MNPTMLRLLLLIALTCSRGNAEEAQSAADMIGSAMHTYAAVIDRIIRLYHKAIQYHPRPPDDPQFSERETSRNPKQMLFDRYAHPPSGQYDDVHIPILDDLLNAPTEDEEYERYEPSERESSSTPKPQRNAFEHIRRRLQEEPVDEIVCNNTEDGRYDADYKFIFQPFADCNVISNSSRGLPSGSGVFGVNEPILYSPDCHFMLILNGISGALQVIASQQTLPLWSSNASTIRSSSEFTMRFDSDTGELRVRSGVEVVWSAMNSSHWVTDHDFQSPFDLVFGDQERTLLVVDSNGATRWLSDDDSRFSESYKFRETLYSVDLVDGEGHSAYSMSMTVSLAVHKEQHLHLQTSYAIPSGNLSDGEQQFVDLMVGTEYSWNVSVYEVSTMPVGDHFVVYPDDLPMIYRLPADGSLSERLSISESHTFLCIDDESKYFKVEVLPHSSAITASDESANYTLTLSVANDSVYVYHGNDRNYTMKLDPWNPCNVGQPVLAQNANRDCFVQYDLDAALSKYASYSANAAYSKVAMQFVFDSMQCAKYFVGNASGNLTTASCQEMGSDFASAQCEAARAECGGYFELCLDFTRSLCTCLCPRDKAGVHCEEFRDYQCSLNILTANMTECEWMTQEDLNRHGRSDYDVTIDGDKPCFFIADDAESSIDSVIQLECAFVDSDSRSRVWEDLVDYNILDENVSFSYCLGNETSTFALTRSPPQSFLRLKIFNFARIFSDGETTIIPLDINHWSGDKYIEHSRSMADLADDYKTGGRVYIEYQLWQQEGSDSKDDQTRISVERRFYDIDHWKMPQSEGSVLSAAQKGFIAFMVLLVVAMVGCITWKCSRWCKKLEHEKTD